MWIGSLILCFAAAALLIIPGEIELIEGASPGPRSLPTFYAWALAALSALLILRAAFQGSREKIVLTVNARELSW